jgi:hypothetical protein
MDTGLAPVRRQAERLGIGHIVLRAQVMTPP